jgi:isopenicillin N synthase-like dioxygenase
LNRQVAKNAKKSVGGEQLTKKVFSMTIQRDIQTSVPVLDASLLHSNRPLFADQLREVAHDFGFFYLVNHDVPDSLYNTVIEEARRFFDLPAADKQALDIKGSPYFRGYSEMKNERDWREQIHFGFETEDLGTEPAYRQLQGPNLWAAALGASWQKLMLDYLDAVEAVGKQLLSVLAEGVGLASDYFDKLSSERAYLLMKLICYHPQTSPDVTRSGVAPHCDWSLLTFLHQDTTGGLQAQTRAGDWLDVHPIQGAFAVNLGEMVEIITRGYYRATPHRVINRSTERARISIPVFVNPPMDAVIQPETLADHLQEDWYAKMPPSPNTGADHVHRVSVPGQVLQPFVFGTSECAKDSVCGVIVRLVPESRMTQHRRY